MDKTITEYRFEQIKRIAIAVVIVLILSAIGFTYFRISSEGHAALREGKNVKLAMDMLSVEYHGVQKSIYNADNADGLTKGVRERLLEVVECENPQITLIAFHKKKNEVLYFTYENDDYRVTYKKDEDGEHWSVDYMINIQNYDN